MRTLSVPSAIDMSQQGRQSDLKSGCAVQCAAVGPDLKTGVLWVLFNSIDGGTQHRFEGIILGKFYLIIYKSVFSEKSPLWKVFSSRIPVDGISVHEAWVNSGAPFL